MKEIFKGIPRKRIFADLSLSLLWGVLNAMFSDLLALQVTRVLNADYDFVTFAISFTGFIFMWVTLEMYADIHGTITSQYIENEVRSYYLHEMYYTESKVLKDKNTGYISGLVNKTIAHRDFIYRRLTLFLPLSISYIMYFTIRLGKIHYSLAVTLILIVLASFMFRFIINKIVRKYNDRLTVAEGIRDKIFLDSALNINTVQKMYALSFIDTKLRGTFDNVIKLTKQYSIIEEIGFCGNKFIGYMFAPISILVFNYVIKDESLVQEFLSVVTVISIQIVHQTKDLNTVIARWGRYKSVVNKLEEIFSLENRKGKRHIEDFFKFSIKDMSYQYVVEGDTKPVTVNIPEFSFRKGDKVCIYGESGQGKTTTLNLVSGEIKSDKVEINNKATTDTLDCVYIAQDTEILDMSLYDNLTLGRNVDRSKIISLLCRVGLGEWFDKQEKGLGTILGERGVFVSTGQRQRLNLIRGLLMDNHEIYLLDEPTSNVDEDTEERMIELIKTMLRDKTVIIVTHKPKIMEICNKVYKFENGIMNLERFE